MIGIIGGYGIHQILSDPETLDVETEYGKPSGPIYRGMVGGRDVCLLPRHGLKHQYPPHMVPYRANISALSKAGCQRIIAVSAVGSLQEDYAPGSITILDQFIDFTKTRKYTFNDGPKTYHPGFADPFCEAMRQRFSDGAEKQGLKHQPNGTYVCVEGPRFSTRAESRMLRNYADVIGMTMVPEINLAVEKELCYCGLALVTDYDVWAERPVEVEEVLRVMKENQENVISLLERVIPELPENRECHCGNVMKNAGI